MKRIFKRGLSIAAMIIMVAGTAVGCSGGKEKELPSPTPRGKVTSAPTSLPSRGKQPVAGEELLLLQPAGTYEKVYEAIKTVRESENYRNGMHVSARFDMVEENVALSPELSAGTGGMDFEVSADGADSAVSKGDKFSGTNVQVEGIDEADIIKTDGKYLYIFNHNRNEIYLVKANGGAPELVSVIDVSKSIGSYETGCEMYLLEDRLVLLVSGYRFVINNQIMATEPINGDSSVNVIPKYPKFDREYSVTKILTYDISKKEAPALLSTLEQDGRLITSRCTGGNVYTVTTNENYFNWYYIMDREEDAEEGYDLYIPMAGGKMVPPECIYISKEPDSEEFLVVTAMSPKQPEEYLDVKSMMADGDECYVSSNYIYVASRRWQNADFNYDRTELYRFSYGEGTITPAGQVTVKGTLNDQFSMDEHNGYLRIVTTVNETNINYSEWEKKLEKYTDEENMDQEGADLVLDWVGTMVTNTESNALYIYDENLQLTGSIENLAKDEEIKSARLMGDVGYFVTFRQTDPLFSVDLSNPAQPKVLGELKIPGFSAYLHPYGEDLLLGIGYDADERTGITEGVKLSMFDVSDPSDVKEIHKISLKEFSSTAVSSNHKAALIDVEENMIGFPVRGYGDNGEYNVYLIYGYDKEKGFFKKFSEGYALNWDGWEYDFKYDFFYTDCRGAFIGDIFYMIQPSYEVKAFNRTTWEPCGREGLVKEMEDRKAFLEKVEEINPAPVVIELEANPSTGYMWQSNIEGDSVVLDGVENLVPEGSEALVGAPIMQRYTFAVNGIGTTTAVFSYARAWDSGSPLRTVVYTITVDENLEAKITSVTEE